MARKMLSEYGKIGYWLAIKKENLRHDYQDFKNQERYAKELSSVFLPNVIKTHDSILCRKLQGVDENLQQNKVINLKLATAKINGIIIYPRETFSLWKLVGKISKQKGYLSGLVIEKGEVVTEIGGGLCQLANLIHWLVLHTPLEVTELHHHGDSLFPDNGRRVPFGTGTSVYYRTLDYRFKNILDQPIQLHIWLDTEKIYGKVLSLRPLEYNYEIEEVDSHFALVDDKYYRRSKIYQNKISKICQQVITKKLILENNSKVMYDYSYIPTEQIKNIEE